jgi:predicted CXXCH cytochrome family protein
MVGPYQLNVEPAPPDVNLSVSLMLANQLPDDYQDLKTRTHAPLPNAFKVKWHLSVWLAALAALIFLVLPLAQNFIPQLHTKMAELPYGFDRVWSPGRISASHRQFGSQCVNCHQTPFEKVTDKACMTCHQDIAPHLADPDLQSRALKAAHRFIGSMRCAECHQEHKSPHPLAKQDNAMCIKCHGKIKEINPETALPNITDFEKKHPEFKLSVKTGPNLTDIERIVQTDKALTQDQSGLIFPHDQHIGKVQGPNGMLDVRELTCTSCHQPEGKEMRFKPLSFKTNCITCHANLLELGDKENPLKVPHGDEQNVFNTLKLNAPKAFDRYSDSLKDNGCAYCHEIEKNPKKEGFAWRIMPLRLNVDWFTKAQFNHAAHRTQQCVSCHKIEESVSSADIAIPDKQSCLLCHSGNKPKHKRIASNCMSCHNFHQAHQGLNLVTGAIVESKDVDVLLSIPDHADSSHH